MTLTTHSVIGGIIIGKLTHNPGMGFLLAFASHFVADAIPHWDYTLISLEETPLDPLAGKLGSGKTFRHDLLIIGTDAVLGLLLTTLLAGIGNFSFTFVWLGAIMAMLPDTLQFAYYRLGGPILTYLQRFHLAIHTKTKLKNQPFLGISLQLLLILIIFSITLVI